jgi:methyl-accepting chemotaxis protein
MEAVKGIFKDAHGEFTVRGEPDYGLALSLVFSKDYISFTDRIMAPMNKVQREVHERTNSHLLDMEERQNRCALAVAAALLLILLLAVVNLAYVSMKVVKRIATVAGNMKFLEAGELTHEIRILHDDEIGALGESYNAALGRMKLLITTIKDKADHLLTTGIQLSTNTAETAGAMDHMNAAILSTKTRVVSQSASVTQTSATMEQIITNIEKLGDHINDQKDSVARASSAIEEMIANIQSVTQTLVKNAQNVNALAESSEVGHRGLTEVSGNVQEVAKESEGLMEINAVMENIASQTNLLSMNAAIEAAHAGEAGKGFAVVADEIRKLAENSSEQSKTISAVLKRIKVSIEKISTSTASVLEQFDSIESGIRTVATQEDAIRAAMEEQNAGSQQILDSMAKVNEITVNVQNGAREMQEGSRQIVSESRNLESATLEISKGMNEMSSGADQVNSAVTLINQNAGQNKEDINALVEEVRVFKLA